MLDDIHNFCFAYLSFLLSNDIERLTTILLSNDIEKLTAALSVYDRESRKSGLKVSWAKTKLIHVCEAPILNL